MAKSDVTCAGCSKVFQKENKEINRVENGRHFCNLSCFGVAHNAPLRAIELLAKCRHCGAEFTTNTKVRAAKHCSSRCATLASETPLRKRKRREAGVRMAGNLLSPAGALKIREASKYADLKNALVDRLHEFEYALESFVFDLALLDTKVLVEFDGAYHRYWKQREIDRKKDMTAARHGFRVVRRVVGKEKTISPSTIVGL